MKRRKGKTPKTADERVTERSEHAANELGIPRAPDEPVMSDEDIAGNEISKEQNKEEVGPPVQLPKDQKRRR